MKYATQLITILLFLAGCSGLIYLSIENKRLAADVSRLETELGKMTIKDVNRVYIAEIKVPDIPTEVASHIEGVWQFRCYLPPGYNYEQFSGGGRVTEEGLFQCGGSSSSWGSPKPTAVHHLLTVSLQKKDNSVLAFYSLGGAQGAMSWNAFNPDRLGTVVVQKLVSSQQGPRSFDQDTILPLLKIYDPSTGKDDAGKSLTTYNGGLFILCPKSRMNQLEQLRNGVTPRDLDPAKIATVVDNE